MVELFSFSAFSSLFFHAEGLRAGPDWTCAPSQRVVQEAKGGGESVWPGNLLFRAGSFEHFEKIKIKIRVKTTAPRIPAWSPTVVLTGRHPG
jgi:hypothetical protein